MREQLADYSNQKVSVSAIVSRFGYYTSNNYSKKHGGFNTVLLLDVKVSLGKEFIELNHLWVENTEEFITKQVKRGSIITFDAYVYEYTKGGIKIHPTKSRKRRSAKTEKWDTTEYNYGIRRVKHVKIIGYSEDVPEEIIEDNGKRLHRNKYNEDY